MGTFQNDYTDNVKIYYRDLKKCEPIPFIRERELILKSKEGDVDARNKIIESNLRFVFNIARKYAGKGIPIKNINPIYYPSCLFFLVYHMYSSKKSYLKNNNLL